jgi:cytochrome c oxidase subunit II
MTLTNIKVSAAKLIRQLACLGAITALAACAKSAPAPAVANGPVVAITASKFHFSPDHITLIKGQPVTIELSSTDATHGFLIRALKIDTDIAPGKVTAITVTPATAGTFKAICDHYCGFGHGGMKMTVVVEESTARSAAAMIASASNTRSQ